jgi:hypothetical protein
MLKSVFLFQPGRVFTCAFASASWLNAYPGCVSVIKKKHIPAQKPARSSLALRVAWRSLARDEDCTMTTRMRAATGEWPRNIDQPFRCSSSADFSNICRLAKGIEHDESRVRDWYLTVTIHEFGDKTASELVQAGDADLVIDFLRSIRRGCRD